MALIQRCDQCGKETDVQEFEPTDDGWLDLERSDSNCFVQQWSFCSQDCAVAYLSRGPLPAGTPLDDPA